MGLTLEQRVERLEGLFTFKADGTAEIKRDVNPAWSNEEVAAFGNVVKVSIGTGATTSPVTTPPVVTTPIGPTELLPDMRAGFKLKGNEKKQEVVEFLKGRTYEGSITVDSVDGGGVYAQGLYPAGNGFGSKGKLEKGVNKISFVSPVTGPHRYSVDANNANASISAATLTLKDA